MARQAREGNLAFPPSAKTRNLDRCLRVLEDRRVPGDVVEARVALGGSAILPASPILVKRHGAEVTFLSSCQGVPAYRHDDSAVAARIAATLPDPIRQCVTLNREFHRPEELIRLRQGFDMLVATRMHMAILSLIAGAPVLPIACEFKTRELFDRPGMGRWVEDINPVDSPALIESADLFLRKLPAVRETAARAARAEHTRALAAVTLVRTHWKAA